jgi:membrane protein YdbS with pleckstrin-like domain
VSRPPRGDGVLLSSPEAELTAERLEAALPAELIEDDEVVLLMLRPSLMFVPLASLGALTVIAVVALVLALLAIRISWIPWSETAAYALGVVVAASRLLWQFLDWSCRIYVLTDRRIIRRMGVLRVSVFEAPLRNIQHTSVFRLLRERLLGLGSIGFATAGSDVFDAFWVMVRQPFGVHRTVVEAIRRYGRH